ncbi:MAG: hypothetical protein ACK4GL_06225 [Flavobacteriales bacterium]
MAEILQFASLFLLTCFKFAFGVPAAYLSFGFNFWETLLFAFFGGSTGIIINLYLSRVLFSFWFWFKQRALVWQPKPKSVLEKKKIFSRRSRLFVKILRQYGLPGLSLITPPIISIPAGCIIATRLYGKSPKVLGYMLLSVVFWSFTFAAVLNLV